jgi:hypothetical protein
LQELNKDEVFFVGYMEQAAALEQMLSTYSAQNNIGR